MPFSTRQSISLPTVSLMAKSTESVRRVHCVNNVASAWLILIFASLLVFPTTSPERERYEYQMKDKESLYISANDSVEIDLLQ